MYETYYAGGVVRGGGRELQDAMASAVGMTPKQFHDMLQSLRVPGGHDPDARVADMDRDGIDVAVLYPSTALFFGPNDPIDAFHDVEFVARLPARVQRLGRRVLRCTSAAAVRDGGGAAPGRPIARWSKPSAPCATSACKVCSSARRRTSTSCRSTTRSTTRSGPRARTSTSRSRSIPACTSTRPGACRKFRLVAESENMMVTNMAMDELHGGSGLGQAVGNTVDMIVTLGRLLMGGVCERFPRLRFLFLESGGGWIPTQLERMDEQVKAFPLEKRWLSLLPSEYFRRQCWAGFEPEEWNLAACAEWLGPDRVLWASDYPHPEFHPEVVKELREAIAPLPDDAQNKILGENAIAAYKLPL